MSYQIKTCPRCGEGLFQDMGVCYGCLYDFHRKGSPTSNILSKVPFIDEEGKAKFNQSDSFDLTEEDEIGEEWDKGLPPAGIEEMISGIPDYVP